MSEMHLKQPGFACGPFTKNKERIEKIMETGNTEYIYKNGLDKACFEYDMAYGKLKEHNQIKFEQIMPLKLHVKQNMMDIKEDKI